MNRRTTIFVIILALGLGYILLQKTRTGNDVAIAPQTVPQAMPLSAPSEPVVIPPNPDMTTLPFSTSTSKDFVALNKHKSSASALIDKINQCERMYKGSTNCFKYLVVSRDEKVALIEITNTWGGDSLPQGWYCLLHDGPQDVECFWAALLATSPLGGKIAFTDNGMNVLVLNIEKGSMESVYASTFESPTATLVAWSGPMGSTGFDMQWTDESTLQINVFDSTKTIPGEYADTQYFKKIKSVEYIAS